VAVNLEALAGIRLDEQHERVMPAPRARFEWHEMDLRTSWRRRHATQVPKIRTGPVFMHQSRLPAKNRFNFRLETKSTRQFSGFLNSARSLRFWWPRPDMPSRG
jgi:hypothetical protein